MNRREALKQMAFAGGTLVGGKAALKNPSEGTVIRQGTRQLKDITPEEIEELMSWCNMNPEAFETVEGLVGEGIKEKSYHPKYFFKYVENSFYAGTGAIVGEYSIRYTFENECDEEEFIITIGELSTRCFPLKGNVETVRWFLDHGFKVF